MIKIKSTVESMQQNTETGCGQKGFTIIGNQDLRKLFPSCDTHDQAKAFIVTGDEDLKGMLKYALDFYDMQVLFCNGGAEALALTTIDPFDYIIIDCDTPGMNGIDHIKRLREKFACSIIIGLSKEDRGVSYLQAGMNDFLQKPFVPYRLAMMLDGGDILA